MHAEIYVEISEQHQMKTFLAPGVARGEYGIAFDTSSAKSSGVLRYVKITIEESTLAPEERVHINLVEHPFYKHLKEYVKSNP